MGPVRGGGDGHRDAWRPTETPSLRGSRGHEATQPYSDQAELAGQVGFKDTGLGRDAGTQHESSFQPEI